MVQEIRQIILSPEELLAAFEAYRHMTPDFLPAGDIKLCKPCANGEVILFLAVTAGKNSYPTEITLRDIDVLKPLIRFCLENNIVLPKEGKKSIAVDYGTIVLEIRLNMEHEIVDYLSPLRMEHLRTLT